jgi:hypothetical protein
MDAVTVGNLQLTSPSASSICSQFGCLFLALISAEQNKHLFTPKAINGPRRGYV